MTKVVTEWWERSKFTLAKTPRKTFVEMLFEKELDHLKCELKTKIVVVTLMYIQTWKVGKEQERDFEIEYAYTA